ncbi:sensor histidine kinase [Glutamicibacter arilaitensis]|uniref:sensor histidine kinase n=1 Tax=Glutamicibacter arilaitensis TaxID=256701 RepID=UPI00384A7845
MTSTPKLLPDKNAVRPPLRIGLTILHLAVLGSIGTAISWLLLGWLAAGAALIFLLGFGIIVLIGLLYALFGLSWLEIQRVSGLYDLNVATLSWRPRRREGFGEYIRSLGRNIASGRMWAAFGSFVLSCIFGSMMIGTLQWTVHTAIVGFAPLSDTDTVFGPFDLLVPASQAPWLFLFTLLGAAVIVGLAFLHRAVTCAIIGAIARESEMTERVRTSSVQREGAVRAAEVERTRIERDLHDGVQPRLVSVGMTLGLAHQQIDKDPAQAKELIAEAHASTKSAITELRQLTRGIYASVLDDRGLDAALSAVAGRSHIPVQLDVQLSGRYPRDTESAVYFAIAEALTNSTKHSRAATCRVTVREREETGRRWLWARIEDNGVGGAQILPGGGLDGINNRVLAAGGTLRLDSPQGGPTAVEVNVPCAS